MNSSNASSSSSSNGSHSDNSVNSSNSSSASISSNSSGFIIPTNTSASNASAGYNAGYQDGISDQPINTSNGNVAYQSGYQEGYQKARAQFPMYVYASDQVNEYSSPDFSASTQVRSFAKGDLTNSPSFRIVGIVNDKNGQKRYKLSNGNYIEANSNVLHNLYYNPSDGVKMIKVIKVGGIQIHSQSDFSDKGQHVAQGRKIKVTQVVKQGTITRFYLSDGRYITSNKQMVQSI